MRPDDGRGAISGTRFPDWQELPSTLTRQRGRGEPLGPKFHRRVMARFLNPSTIHTVVRVARRAT
jgi:hypothetical protein